MENSGYLELGKLFGEHAIWGKDYLPCSEKKTDSVLSELLWDPQKTGYHEHIRSLESYRCDYAKFCEAYCDSLDSPRSVPAKPPYSCVPYWGSEFWKSRPRLAVFAQRSLNKDGASIPLYFPLCEVDNWGQALDMGIELGKKQPKTPFGWQSFMSVWIAMRILFSGNEDKLQSAYYSDLVKTADKDRNRLLLKNEIDIINPDFVLILGKRGYEQFKGLFEQAEVPHIHHICFPCGQGAMPKHDPNAGILHKCQKDLLDYFDSHRPQMPRDGWREPWGG